MFAGLGQRAVDVLRALAARRARRPVDGRRDVRVRRARSTPRSGRTTCSPPSSTRRSRAAAASRCSATSCASPLVSRRERRCRRALPGDRPARRPCRAPARRATTTPRPSTATIRSRWRPSFAAAGRDVDPRRRPRRRPLGRPGEPAVRRGDRRRPSPVPRRCRPAGECGRSPTSRRSPTLGVARVVMGSAAVAEPALVERAATVLPVAVGLDHRDGEVAVHGWTAGSGVRLDDALGWFPTAAAFVITDIGRDGMLGGPDVDGLAAAAASDHDPGHRQRRRRDARRRRRPRRDSGPGRHHHRQGAVRGSVHGRRGAGRARRRCGR